jgi:hypothetical protein
MPEIQGVRLGLAFVARGLILRRGDDEGVGTVWTKHFGPHRMMKLTSNGLVPKGSSIMV